VGEMAEGTVSEFEKSPRTRREVLGLLGGLGAAIFVAGCAGDGGSSTATRSKASSSTTGAATSTSAATTTTTAATAATLAACTKIPEETAGPFPGDGSNGPNVLNQAGVVRSDIRSSFGSSSTVAKGVPLTLNVTVYDTKTGCKPLAGAAVYVWHCDINGGYSMYSQGISGENYLRGVQATDATGTVKFTSIFPAAYDGRWPHIHFEVFPSVASATSYQSKIATSQFAMPQDIATAVFATDGYSQSVRNLAQTSLETDNVFRDGWTLQVPTFTGSPTAGYVATIPVGV